MRKLLFVVALCMAVVAATALAAPASKRGRSQKKTRTTKTVNKKGNKSSQNVKPLTSKAISNERRKIQKEISQTRTKIDENQRRTKANLAALEDINAGIRSQQNQIGVLEMRIDSVLTAMSGLSDTIGVIEARTVVMRDDLKQTLRRMRARRKSVNDIAFVFAAPTLQAAARRVRYLHQLNSWRARKISDLRAEGRRLQEHRAELQQLQETHNGTMTQLNAGRRTLEARRNRQQQIVGELRKETKTLNAVLTAKQRRMQQLDKELDRIIAQEAEERRRAEAARKAKAEAEAKERAAAEARAKAKKQKGNDKTVAENKTKSDKTATPDHDNAARELDRVAEADRKLSGNFAANRGRLLFPVSGRYTVVSNFGRNKHGDVSNVVVNNSGVDIAVAPGSSARAVFDGTVSSVFFMPGYNNIVILRHGKYLTVYAGLSDLKVRKGATVKAGATLGRVQAGDDDDGRAVLHFEVRHEREKLNPLDWVR